MKKFKSLVYTAIILFICVIMFFSFTDNSWNVVKDDDWFESFEAGSEHFVVGAMAKNRVSSSFKLSEQSLGAYIAKNPDDLEEKVKLQINIFEDSSMYNGEGFGKYDQQIGLQAVVFSLIDKAFGYNLSLSFFRAINSILLILVLIPILIWAKREFGIISFIIVALSIIFNQWLIVMGRNLYWCFWLAILPFSANLFYLTRREKVCHGFNIRTLCILSFSTIFIKSTCGYEYISICMVALTLPYIYYSYVKKVGWKKFVKNFLLISLSAISGFIVCVLFHIIFKSITYGDNLKFMDLLKLIIGKNTILYDVDQTLLTENYKKVINVDYTFIINTYFNFNYVQDMKLLYIFTMKHIIYFAICMFIAYFFTRCIKIEVVGKEKHNALLLISFISLLGPLSWMIIAKGHAFIHFFINYVMWSIPCIFLFAAYIGYTINIVCVSYINKALDLYNKFRKS